MLSRLLTMNLIQMRRCCLCCFMLFYVTRSNNNDQAENNLSFSIILFVSLLLYIFFGFGDLLLPLAHETTMTPAIDCVRIYLITDVQVQRLCSRRSCGDLCGAAVNCVDRAGRRRRIIVIAFTQSVVCKYHEAIRSINCAQRSTEKLALHGNTLSARPATTTALVSRKHSVICSFNIYISHNETD